MSADGDSTCEAVRSYASIETSRIRGTHRSTETDFLAVEEPLEIRLASGERGRRVRRAVSITMRTPGDDVELAAGFLYTEGILESLEQLARINLCKTGNVVCVNLRPGVTVDLARLERNFYTTSSCGVCGKTSLEAVQVQPRVRIEPGWPTIDAATINGLPTSLRAAQDVFERTGGLHAAALFDSRGELLSLREDVGRHNALDKLIGGEFLSGRMPLSQKILLVSGRASFELVQKSVVAGIPVMAAVGAPSSLAVALARQSAMTLLGFVRDERFNVYADAGRLAETAQGLFSAVT